MVDDRVPSLCSLTQRLVLLKVIEILESKTKPLEPSQSLHTRQSVAISILLKGLLGGTKNMILGKQIRNKHKEWGSRVIPNPSWTGNIDVAYGRWIFPRQGKQRGSKKRSQRAALDLALL